MRCAAQETCSLLYPIRVSLRLYVQCNCIWQQTLPQNIAMFGSSGCVKQQNDSHCALHVTRSGAHLSRQTCKSLLVVGIKRICSTLSSPVPSKQAMRTLVNHRCDAVLHPSLQAACQRIKFDVKSRIGNRSINTMSTSEQQYAGRCIGGCITCS